MDNAKPTVFSNPFKIYGLSFLLFGLVYSVGSIALHVGGANTTTINDYCLAVGAYYGILVLIIASVTTFTHRQWFKKFWLINVVIIIIVGLPLCFVLLYALIAKVC